MIDSGLASTNFQGYPPTEWGIHLIEFISPALMLNGELEGQFSGWLRPTPVPAGKARLGKVDSPMPLRSGRLEKRIEVAIPLQISTLLDPETEERTTTENVCSLGIRVVTEHSRQLDERLMIRSLTSNLRRLARVVYCQRLSDGHFAVGLQFQGGAVKWSDDSTSFGTPLAAVLASFLPRFVFC